MTVTHKMIDSSPFGLAAEQVAFEAYGSEHGHIFLGYYPTISALSVGIDNEEIGSFPLEEFKKFARKVLADELAEPPAPEWHSAKVIRGEERGKVRLFLRNIAGNFLTDTGAIWSPELTAENVSDIEIVVGADDE